MLSPPFIFGKAVYISWRSSRAPGASSQFTSQRLWPVGSESCRFAPRFWRTRRQRRIFYTLGHSDNLIISSLGSNRCEGQTVNTQVCAAKSENRFCVLGSKSDASACGVISRAAPIKSVKPSNCLLIKSAMLFCHNWATALFPRFTCL